MLCVKHDFLAFTDDSVVKPVAGMGARYCGKCDKDAGKMGK
jgi:hypothetical protein